MKYVLTFVTCQEVTRDESILMKQFGIDVRSFPLVKRRSCRKELSESFFSIRTLEYKAEVRMAHSLVFFSRQGCDWQM